MPPALESACMSKSLGSSVGDVSKGFSLTRNSPGKSEGLEGTP